MCAKKWTGHAKPRNGVKFQLSPARPRLSRTDPCKAQTVEPNSIYDQALESHFLLNNAAAVEDEERWDVKEFQLDLDLENSRISLQEGVIELGNIRKTWGALVSHYLNHGKLIQLQVIPKSNPRDGLETSQSNERQIERRQSGVSKKSEVCWKGLVLKIGLNLNRTELNANFWVLLRLNPSSTNTWFNGSPEFLGYFLPYPEGLLGPRDEVYVQIKAEVHGDVTLSLQ
ncbi:hypothetical protein K438DRAFT_1782468 [Mycena galopus ATCC 62051]|nr:hypothetical protein K438DRAFT_1782468 [Mycena galopus ATCC 62051]